MRFYYKLADENSIFDLADPIDTESEPEYILITEEEYLEIYERLNPSEDNEEEEEEEEEDE